MTNLQTCPGNSYLVSQFSSASEAEDDEAEYQYCRHRALVRPHLPLSEQNITVTRGSRLGLTPFSPSSIGCSADASYAIIPAPTSIQLDCAPAYSAQEFRFGAHLPLTPALNSSQSCFDANFLSHFPLSNLAAPQFGFGAQDDLTPDLNSSQNRSDAESSISQRSSSSGLFAFGKAAEAAKLPEMHHKKVPCFNPPCLLPDRDTIFTFPENNFFQQILQRSSSHGTFAFGSTAEAVKPPEMHHKQVPSFTPHCVLGVGGNAARPTDYEKAANLMRDTQLSIEDNLLRLQRERSNTWIAHLEGLGNDEEQFCRNSHISLEIILFLGSGQIELLENIFGLLYD